MNRRAFLRTLAGGVLAASLAAQLTAEAQQSGKGYRIGVLETTSPALNAANLGLPTRAAGTRVRRGAQLHDRVPNG